MWPVIITLMCCFAQSASSPAVLIGGCCGHEEPGSESIRSTTQKRYRAAQTPKRSGWHWDVGGTCAKGHFEESIQDFNRSALRRSGGCACVPESILLEERNSQGNSCKGNCRISLFRTLRQRSASRIRQSSDGSSNFGLPLRRLCPREPRSINGNNSSPLRKAK